MASDGSWPGGATRRRALSSRTDGGSDVRSPTASEHRTTRFDRRGGGAPVGSSGLTEDRSARAPPHGDDAEDPLARNGPPTSPGSRRTTSRPRRPRELPRRRADHPRALPRALVDPDHHGVRPRRRAPCRLRRIHRQTARLLGREQTTRQVLLSGGRLRHAARQSRGRRVAQEDFGRSSTRPVCHRSAHRRPPHRRPRHG